jgi:isopenicillin-N epimerase
LAEGRSRFHLEHDWIGTADPTPWLALPEALRLLGSGPLLLQRQQAMHRMAMAIEPLLLEALRGAGCPALPMAPASARAAMVAVPLPALSASDGSALQRRLLARGFQVPVIAQQPHQATARQFLRVSCFAYNQLSDGIALAEVLPAALEDQAARR